MDITRLTVLVAAALLATACANTEPLEVASAPETVAVADTQDAAVEEDAPAYSRRRGCANGYAPVGTRVKRCVRSEINDVRVSSPNVLRNAGYGSASEMSNGAIAPPQD
jgi:hypothetical protein